MQWVKQMLGQVQSKDDFLKAFTSIRGDVGKAKTGADLSDLHEKAGGLMNLTKDNSWLSKAGDVGNLGDLAKNEYARTSQKINERAREIGADANFSETWQENR
jgi:hypothetical protein